jgi:hypothetical protein
VSSTVKKDARAALAAVIAAILMLMAGLIAVFAPLRKLTLGSDKPTAPEVHAGQPELQGAQNDAASPDVAAAPSPAVAIGPGAEMLASDAGAAEPSELIADAGEESGPDVFEGATVATHAGEGRFADAAAEMQPPHPVVFCGLLPCAPGKVCCNPSCGICTDPGQVCSHLPCLSSTTPVSIYCGPNTCNVGQVCCNETCGTCVSPGQTCDQTPCSNPPTIPISFTCGMATCNVGMVCCNASCGICALPGETCSTEVCD